MTAAAEVRILSYSGKLGWPPGVRARARRRPPVSAMMGGINPRHPRRARIHRRAYCSWIQTATSRVAAAPNSSVTQLRAALSGSDRRLTAPPHERASVPEYRLHRAGPSLKQSAPYIHHTTLDRERQSGPLLFS